jgi:hypothetical protein
MGDEVADVTHPSASLFDRHLAGALDEARTAELLAHVDSCTSCAAKMRDLEAERTAFLALHPPEARAAELLETRAHDRRRRLFARFAFGGAAAAAACALFFVLSPIDRREKILEKGGPVVHVSVRAPDGRIRRGESGETFEAGASIQLSVDPARFHRVVVYAFDASEKLDRVMEAMLDRPTDLQSSLVLDDSSAPEVLLVVFSDTPVEDERVRESATRALRAVGGDLGALEVAIPDTPAIVRTILVRKR